MHFFKFFPFKLPYPRERERERERERAKSLGFAAFFNGHNRELACIESPPCAIVDAEKSWWDSRHATPRRACFPHWPNKIPFSFKVVFKFDIFQNFFIENKRYQGMFIYYVIIGRREGARQNIRFTTNVDRFDIRSFSRRRFRTVHSEPSIPDRPFNNLMS